MSIRTSLLRKGYLLYRDISNGNFARVWLAYHFKTGETRVVKYPATRVVGVNASWGCVDVDLTNRIKHVRVHIKAADKLKRVEGIPEQYEHFEIFFPIIPRILDITTYDPMKDSSMCSGNLRSRYEWFSYRYKEFFNTWRIPVSVSRHIRGTKLDIRYADEEIKQKLRTCLANASARGVSLEDFDREGNLILEERTRVPFLVDLGSCHIRRLPMQIIKA